MPLSRFAPGILALAMTLFASACSQDEAINKFASPEEKAIASGFIDQARKGQVDEIEARLVEKLRSPEVHGTLQKIAELVPKGEPDSVTLVGANRNYGTGGSLVNLTYQYQFGKRWFLINCATTGEGDALRIAGLNVREIPRSLEEENSFSLGGKGFSQYAALAAAVALPLLCLYALVLCIRDKNLRRKWAWILFIVFGIGKVALNWSTGEWSYHFVTFLLFSVGTYSELYGPWNISLALPLGALVYLIKRHRNQNPAPLSNPS